MLELLQDELGHPLTANVLQIGHNQVAALQVPNLAARGAGRGQLRANK